MKFNWGHGIFLVIVTIVVSFSAVLINSLGEEHEHHLVAKDYYAKELAYQDQIDWSNNATEQHKDVFVAIGEDKVIVSFDSSSTEGSGQIHFYRPSNSGLDQLLKFNLQGNSQYAFDLAKFTSGKYLVKVTWEDKERTYYVEKSVFIP